MEPEKASVLEGVVVGPPYKYRAERILSLLEKLSGRKPEGVDPLLAGDLYYTFYLPFPVVRRDLAEGAEERVLLVAGVLADSKTWKIKAYTVADPALSMVAATVLINALAQARSGGSLGDRRKSSASGGERQQSALSRAIGDALEAVKNAAAAKSILEKMGAGNTSSLLFEDTLDIVMDLAKRTSIREIERILSGIQVSRVQAPREAASPRGWAKGVELGGDLERVHPSRLAFPEELFLAELANSRLLLYRKHLNAGLGDVYVLLDKSGSMSGDKMNWARAVAIALLIKARAQRRRFRLRYFDSIVYKPIEVSPGARPRVMAEALREIATVKASGGTNITRAIAKALDDLSSVRRASDIVIITDGEDKLLVHVLRSMLQKSGVRLHSVMIKGDNPALASVSTSYMVAEKLDSDEGLRVVRRVMRKS
ncbi:MAG: VWA domain-containing protein [Desulfurococcales archaeon]|nr:VWA domain-containing protein [Desulfurococcales archaeon]